MSQIQLEWNQTHGQLPGRSPNCHSHIYTPSWNKNLLLRAFEEVLSVDMVKHLVVYFSWVDDRGARVRGQDIM